MEQGHHRPDEDEEVGGAQVRPAAADPLDEEEPLQRQHHQQEGVSDEDAEGQDHAAQGQPDHRVPGGGEADAPATTTRRRSTGRHLRRSTRYRLDRPSRSRSLMLN